MLLLCSSVVNDLEHMDKWKKKKKFFWPIRIQDFCYIMKNRAILSGRSKQLLILKYWNFSKTDQMQRRLIEMDEENFSLRAVDEHQLFVGWLCKCSLWEQREQRWKPQLGGFPGCDRSPTKLLHPRILEQPTLHQYHSEIAFTEGGALTRGSDTRSLCRLLC